MLGGLSAANLSKLMEISIPFEVIQHWRNPPIVNMSQTFMSSYCFLDRKLSLSLGRHWNGFHTSLRLEVRDLLQKIVFIIYAMCKCTFEICFASIIPHINQGGCACGRQEQRETDIYFPTSLIFPQNVISYGWYSKQLYKVIENVADQ